MSSERAHVAAARQPQSQVDGIDGVECVAGASATDEQRGARSSRQEDHDEEHDDDRDDDEQRGR